MTKEYLEEILTEYGVAFTDSLADRLLKEFKSCEDEYIKVPKKALKYRTAGMVAYNAEWLKNHFDIERAVICGAQEPCIDLCESCDTKGCIFQSGIKREKCDFYTSEKRENDRRRKKNGVVLFESK